MWLYTSCKPPKIRTKYSRPVIRSDSTKQLWSVCRSNKCALTGADCYVILLKQTLLCCICFARLWIWELNNFTWGASFLALSLAVSINILFGTTSRGGPIWSVRPVWPKLPFHFDKPIYMGKWWTGKENGKSDSSWSAGSIGKCLFTFFWFVPLVSDPSVWHNG